MNEPASGNLLIANPHLDDPNFLRTVVFVCEHNEEGSFGFVLNRKTNYVLGDFVPEMESFNIPVYEGGPVELNTLHFLHELPEAISGGKEIKDGIYWGGNFEEAIALIRAETVDSEKIRFYLGYSGWSEGQLNTEMEEKTWIISPANTTLVFHTNYQNVWRDALKYLGGDYKLIINAPIDPQLN